MTATSLIGESKPLTTLFLNHFEQQIIILIHVGLFFACFFDVYYRICYAKCKHQPLIILYKFSDKGIFIFNVTLKPNVKSLPKNLKLAPRATKFTFTVVLTLLFLFKDEPAIFQTDSNFFVDLCNT